MLYFPYDNRDTFWPEAATDNRKKAFDLCALNMYFEFLQRQIIIIIIIIIIILTIIIIIIISLH